MKTYVRPALVALAALGLVASVASLYVHYQLNNNPDYVSFCDVTETVSCEAVLQSEYASVGGIPVAAGGAIWSALVLLLAWFGMKERPSVAGAPAKAATPSTRRGQPAAAVPVVDQRAVVAGYIFVLATIGLAAVLYLGYASFFVLQRWCLLCITTYVSVIGTFIVSGGAASVSLGALPARASRDVAKLTSNPAAASMAAAWVIGSIALVVLFPRTEPAPAAASFEAPPAPTETLSPQEMSQFAAFLDAQPREELPIPSDGASVVVVKFNDYQCPACRQTYLEYKWIRDKYREQAPDAVKFVSVDFPLESECGVGNIHPSACEAAAAVRLAQERNLGEEMEEWLFANQATLTPDLVRQGVREIAGIEDFDAQYPRVLAQVREDAQLGQRLNITGTPTFFINGIRIGTSLRPSYFDAAIQHELQKAEASAGPGES